ncbi:MAG: molybdenum cofactor guanylyltransferase [Bdellovibrionales bacterium]|nr:molybdenum cofactor guanylyltransferase [Bdellovibrionales bacterium]
MKLVGVILAGGKSTRMGQDKPELAWRGETLLKHQFNTLCEIVDSDAVFVSGKRPGFQYVPDLEGEKGPLEGVRSVLLNLVKRFSDFYAFVVPVDMPFLSSWDLNALKNEAGDADVCIFEGTNLPVYISNPVKVMSMIGQMNDGGEASGFSFKALYKRLKVKRIPKLPKTELLNLNTPEELHEAISKTDTPF